MPDREKTRGTFVPKAEQMQLWPSISGNRINGLGDPALRRPTPIYWHAPELTPHGPLQRWMMEQGSKIPELQAQREARAQVMANQPVPIADNKLNLPAAENAQRIKELALASGAQLVGIARMDPLWVYEGFEFDFPWLILLGIAMDYERLREAPAVAAAVAVVEGYTNCWRAAQPVADHIRAMGWRADPRGGPLAGPVNLLPAALASGFGELGKHGSIINGEFGSSFRIGAVFTDLPLVADGPADIAAEDFCLNCQVCIDACPVDAITDDKQLVRGVAKWYVDFDKCLPFFNEHAGCAVCIAACPWSVPGRSPKLTAKMLRRRERHPADRQT